ncbi:MAG: hypothetical protein Q4D30_03515 [Bacteroidales bacterium]|nr:hypothetical protein [Bacteroidaceae bacterium]MDO4185544.1 hypothetical protein [Bacteroidales bacterium]
MRNLVIVLFCMTFLLSCSKNNPSPSENYMILGDVEYVKDFPIQADLGNAEESGYDVIGILNFQVCDTMLMVSLKGETAGFWQFYSLKKKNLIGRMLGVGQGPNEFLMPVYSENQYTIKKEANKWYATIYDNMKGGIYRLDISGTLQGENLLLQKVNSELAGGLISVKELEDGSFICRELAEQMTKQNRYVLKNGEKVVPETLNMLNMSEVVDGDGGFYDMNLISSSIRVHDNLIVEVPVYLNYINLYSLDGSVGKTICTDSSLSSISSLLAQNNTARKRTYTAVQTFDDFFGVCAYYHTAEEEKLNAELFSQIQLFSYEGKPLASFRLKRQVSAFDIDFANGDLYVLSSSTDEFVKYDINELLRQIVVD